MRLKKASSELFKVHICCTVKNKSRCIDVSACTDWLSELYSSCWGHISYSLEPSYWLKYLSASIIYSLDLCSLEETPYCVNTKTLSKQRSGGRLYENCILTLVTPTKGEVFALHCQMTPREGQANVNMRAAITLTALHVKLFARSEGRRFYFNHVI